MQARTRLIKTGFALFQATGLHRLAAPWTRGRGAILMFHHVRPWAPRDFAPNRLLEITPDFLDAVLRLVRRRGLDIVSLDEALARLPRPDSRPFVVLTFDDGYRDNQAFALPVLERHAAPFSLFVTTGFADRSARLWWVELERAIGRLGRVEVEAGGDRIVLSAADVAAKRSAFDQVYWALRRQPEDVLLAAVGGLAAQAGIDAAAVADELCLDWRGIEAMAAHPLCTIGAHTLTHPMLAKHDASFARREMAESKRILETRLSRAVRHFAYPVGDPTSAAARDFALARDAGFAAAVTTRPGMLFSEHAAHTTALPRLSINGAWQDVALVDVLLSGAPFALWNRGRRVVN